MTESHTISLSVLDIIECTTVDGPGFRTSIYAAGCENRCVGCHNPHSWDINNGHRVDIDSIMNRITADEFANVTFSGGDPMYQIEGFTTLAKRIKTETSKTIWCYTGYLFEDIVNSNRYAKILPYIDVLVDGKFEKEKADEALVFRGSSNQRIIDVQASVKHGTVIKLNREKDISI